MRHLDLALRGLPNMEAYWLAGFFVRLAIVNLYMGVSRNRGTPRMVGFLLLMVTIGWFGVPLFKKSLCTTILLSLVVTPHCSPFFIDIITRKITYKRARGCPSMSPGLHASMAWSPVSMLCTNITEQKSQGVARTAEFTRSGSAVWLRGSPTKLPED